MAEPVAWAYEIAMGHLPDGTYHRWEWRVTFTKPNVPEGAVRNLTPLYSK